MWQVKTNSEVDQFIEGLEIATRGKVRNVINLLKEYGHLLRSPHSKKIIGYDNLFELRSSGNSPIRLFYTIYKNEYYILHGFVKKTNKTPIREINVAISKIGELTS